MELECAFHKEMHLLEVKYEQMKAELEKKVRSRKFGYVSENAKNIAKSSDPWRLRAHRGGKHVDIRRW